jgi:plastocyanin
MRLSSFLLPLLVASLAFSGCTSKPTSQDILGHAEHFENADRTVAAGEVVTFRMKTASHTVDFSEDEGPVLGVSRAHSGNLNPGDTFEVAFSEPGTYPYFCRYHSFLQGGERAGMVGTITVTG